VKQRGIFFLIAIIVFYFAIIIFSDITKISTDLEKIKLEYYPLIFLLVIINIILLGIRFHFLLKKLDLKLKLSDSLLVFISGLSMVLTPGAGGTIIKSFILKKKIGKSYSSTTPLIIYEKWLELTSILIVIGILLFWINFTESIIVFIIGIVFNIIFLIAFKNEKGLDYINNLIQKIGFLKNLTINVKEARDSFDKLTSLRITIGSLLITLVTKINAVVIIFLIFESFGINFDFLLSGQIYFTSFLIGVLSFIPGGIIVTEASLIGLILKQGVELSMASILVLVIRFVTLWFAMIIGLVALKVALNKNFLEDKS